ncbi:FitA-like ribbon-helix-helix domain-containing protein [Haematomicrobium sanguinis]|uniref:FitA-like ribbon-helix-helix domain-containing protein n=1 Tax=Haematomicrobium sanguinis TaxID=479106 RepID=UPI00047957AC|nr:antitoxin [Haematomicrobium sanguinis]
MEQILIRNLPPGTKAALAALEKQHNRSVESEARAILLSAVTKTPRTLPAILKMTGDIEIDFEPERLGMQARSADL